MVRKIVTATFSFFCKGAESNEYVEAYMKALLDRFRELDLPEHVDLEKVEVKEE